MKQWIGAGLYTFLATLNLIAVLIPPHTRLDFLFAGFGSYWTYRAFREWKVQQ